MTCSFLSRSAALLLVSVSSLQALEWDPDPSLPGAQGGSGTWLGAQNQWLDGLQNGGWIENSSAVFGGNAGIVDIDGIVQVDDLTFSIDGYTLKGVAGTSAQLNFNGIAGPHEFKVDSGSSTISDVAVISNSGFVKKGQGTLTVAANLNHSVTGQISIQDGVLDLGAGFANSGTVFNLAGSGAKLTIATGNSVETIGALQGSGVVNLGSGRLIIAGGQTVANFAGLITGPGSLEIRSFNQKLSFNNSFTGGVTIVNSTLSFPVLSMSSDPGPLGQGGVISLGDSTNYGGLNLGYDPGSAIKDNPPATTDRPFYLAPGGGVIYVTSRNHNILTGNIDGPGGLRTEGPGILELRGDKTYTGNTNVASGSFILAGSIRGSAVKVGTGGFLSGASFSTDDATRTTGPFTLASGGSVRIGRSSMQKLNTSNLIFEGGNVTFGLAVGGLSDQFDVTGSVTFKGLVDLYLESDNLPASNYMDVYRLLINDGTDPTILSGSNARFRHYGNILEDGEIFQSPSGHWFQIFYGLDSTDNDVRVVAVPETSVAALTLFAMPLLFGRKRKSFLRR